MKTQRELDMLIGQETDNARIDAIILGYARKVELSASIRTIKVNNKPTAGIFIDGHLQGTFEGLSLIAEIDRLRALGFSVDLG